LMSLATRDELLRIANDIKAHTEAKGKSEFVAFVRSFRKWNETHQGVTPETFWAIVERVTGKRPRDPAG